MKKVSTILLVFMMACMAVFAAVGNANEAPAECNVISSELSDEFSSEPSDEMLAQRAKELGLEYTPGLEGEDRYYSKYGEPIYPPNDGALNTPEKVILKAGTIVTRYGRVKGSYFGTENDTFEQRSLPRTTDKKQFHKLRLLKDMPVEEAIIAPWFGQPGGGTQYKISNEIFAQFDEYLQEVQ